PVSHAAEFVGHNQAGQVLVSATSTHKNLYAAGSTVLMNGSTTGDLTVIGGSITVNGPVSGELLAAGGNVYKLFHWRNGAHCGRNRFFKRITRRRRISGRRECNYF